MILNKNLKNKLAYVTAYAAVKTYDLIGKKNKILADKAAVDAMRTKLNNLDINGQIVIGEGELDEAPMLYIGEKVGTGQGISLDIAVDPVEGTNFVANNLPGGLSVLAVAEKGNLFNAPETYMNKIAYGSDVPKLCLDLDYTITKNINNFADYKKIKTNDITVCLLDRPRHDNIIKELNKLNVKIKLLTDGDVAGALMVTDKKYGVDIFMGIGGGPEGVLAACALDSFNCKFQGRFLFETSKDKSRAKNMGILDLNKKYNINEIVKGESIFCASGITGGDLVNGLNLIENKFIVETLVTHKNSSVNIEKIEIPNTWLLRIYAIKDFFLVPSSIG